MIHILNHLRRIDWNLNWHVNYLILSKSSLIFLGYLRHNKRLVRIILNARLFRYLNRLLLSYEISRLNLLWIDFYKLGARLRLRRELLDRSIIVIHLDLLPQV